MSAEELALPLLITGVTGVAGYNALSWFARLYPGQVLGIRPLQTWQLTGPEIVAIDMEDRDSLLSLFDRHRFRSVLNATGNCALKSCELNPAMAERTNVKSALNITEASRSSGARLVHLSSDLVYSGVGSGGYRETDPTDPVTVYGRTMAEGEAIVRAQTPDAGILRISLPMGPSFSGHAGAIDWIQSRFRAGRPATLYFDELRSCTYVHDLNRVFHTFLAGTWSGLYHAGGPRALTLYQIGQIINRVGGYAPHLLHGCPRHQAGPMPPRAGNVSMNSEKLRRALGYKPFGPWPGDESLFPTGANWHLERAVGEGSVEDLARRLYTHVADEGDRSETKHDAQASVL
jgi:dTDP-4-dehydrorhamnose reductase